MPGRWQDGSIDATNDRQIVGKVRPDWTAGWNNTFSYKNFELSFFILKTTKVIFKNIHQGSVFKFKNTAIKQPYYQYDTQRTFSA